MAGISCPEGEDPCPLACIDDSGKPIEAMICFKTDKSKAQADEAKTKNADEVSNLKASKSRELRAGILYVGCDCEKRNGLQDDCRRTGCQGSPECLTKPSPVCGPSEFSNGKHLLKKGKYASSGGGSSSKAASGGKNGPEGYECIPVIVKKECCRKCRNSG